MATLRIVFNTDGHGKKVFSFAHMKDSLTQQQVSNVISGVTDAYRDHPNKVFSDSEFIVTEAIGAELVITTRKPFDVVYP